MQDAKLFQSAISPKGRQNHFRVEYAEVATSIGRGLWAVRMALQVMGQSLFPPPMLGTGAWQVAVDAPRPSRRYRPAVRDTRWVWRCLLYEVSSPGTGTARSHTAGCRYRVCTSCMRPCWQTGHTTPGSPTKTSGLLGSVASSRAWARGAWP